MAFNFRYEALLSYRRHQKDRAEVEFSRSLKTLREAKESLWALFESRQRANVLLQSDLAGRVPAYTVKNHSDYLSALKHRIAVQSEEVSKCEKMVGVKRGELLQKTKAYKVMEKLREKDSEKWEKRLNELEQKRMDEMAVTRHLRENP